MAIAHGDLPQAVAYHLFSPVVFLFFIVTAIHLMLELRAQRRISTVYTRLILNRSVQTISILLFVAYHAVRLYFLSQTGELYLAMVQSPLGQLLF